MIASSRAFSVAHCAGSTSISNTENCTRWPKSWQALRDAAQPPAAARLDRAAHRRSPAPSSRAAYFQNHGG